MWFIKTTACILVIAFGMQWPLLHMIKLGASALTNNFDTPLPASISGFLENHKDCQVCDSLSKQQQEKGGTQSNIFSELLDISNHGSRRIFVFGANNFYPMHTPPLDHLNWSLNPFLRKKPPKATA